MTRVVCFAHCTSINGKTQLPGMQITLPVTVTESLTLTARPGVAPGNGSIHKLLLYYRPHNMGLRLRHTSLFLTYVLAPLCAISNFNYEQVNPRNFPAAMLLHGRLSFRKPVLPSPSSGLVHRAFPIVSFLQRGRVTSRLRGNAMKQCISKNGIPRRFTNRIYRNKRPRLAGV